MNRCLYVLYFIFLLALGWYHSNARYNKLEHRLAVEAVIREAHIQELEKEIRLLKTDVDVIYYGFPEK